MLSPELLCKTICMRLLGRRVCNFGIVWCCSLPLSAPLCKLRYVQCCLQYFAMLGDLGLDMKSLSQVQAYDVMIQLYRLPEDGEEIPNSCFPLNTLKALRWMVKVTAVGFPDLYSGLFHSVAHNRNEADHRESTPLPLDFVAYLEHALLSETFPNLRFVMGSLLVMIWGSLRFSDALHVRWGTLNYEQGVGRGISFRTKTSVRGAPFGAQGCGLYGGLLYSRRDGVVLLPFHSGEEELYVPMTYGECLATLRHLLSAWGQFSVDQIGNFTLHSCKTTLLSWANQLCLSEELRTVQGHHRQTSARLYSRDDVLAHLLYSADCCRPSSQGDVRCVRNTVEVRFRLLNHLYRYGRVLLLASEHHSLPGGGPLGDASQRCEEVPSAELHGVAVSNY